MGAAAIPLVLAAVGTTASVYNTRQTARKQDNQLAAQLRRQAQHQREADAKTANLIANQAASSDAQDKAGALGQFTQAIQRAQGNAERPLQSVGATSDAYKRAGSDAALGMSQYAGNVADLMSSIDAPMQQRQRDQWQANRFGNDIDQIRRRAGGDDFIDQLRLRNIRRNPWIDAGASMLGGYASNYGALGSGGGGSGGGSLYGFGDGFTYNLPGGG